MPRRPLSITLVSWLFVVVGCASLARHAWEMTHAGEGGAATVPSSKDLADYAWVAVSAALAVGGGVLSLRGRGLGRWVLLAWMAGHVVISLLHSTTEVALHVALFTPLVFLLFRPSAGAFFRGAG